MANSAEIRERVIRSPWSRLVPPVGLAAATAAATMALHFRDPHVQGSWGQCPLNYLTGFDCPGCGGLRAVNDLTHLDLVAAASSNLLFVASVPVLVGLWVAWLVRSWRGNPRPVEFSTPVTVALLVVIIGFAVVRNLPFAAWLAA